MQQCVPFTAHVARHQIHRVEQCRTTVQQPIPSMYLMSSILFPFTGRLLFLTSTSNTSTGNNADHCVDNGAEPAATTDMGTKKSTDVNASKNEVALSVPLPLTQTAAATLTPTQALPKVSNA